jgi:hypothetical protein
MAPRRLTKKQFARALRLHRENGCPGAKLGVCLGPGHKEIDQAIREIEKEEQEDIW